MYPFERFTERAKKVLTLAQEEAERSHHSYIGTEHLLLGLLREGEGLAAKVLNNLGVEIDKVRSTIESVLGRNERIIIQQIIPTSRVKKVIEISFEEARRMGNNYVGTEHLLLGLLIEGEGIAAHVLEDLGANLEKVRGEIEKLLHEFGHRRGVEGGAEEAVQDAAARPVLPRPHRPRQQELARPGDRPRDGDRARHPDPEPAHQEQPGTHRRARRRQDGDRRRARAADHPREHARVADGQARAHARHGRARRGHQVPRRVRGAVEEDPRRDPRSREVVLFIDELHTLVGAGAAEGAIDAANILKPALARGEIQCIGATTLNEYRKYIEKDAALERRFQPVFVDEPTLAETIEILHGIRSLYEKHHRVKITDDALKAAAELSVRYVSDRSLPDKAIDLIDEACARVRMKLTTTPEELRALQREIRELQTQKEEAIAEQDYETAANFRDKEKKLKDKYVSLETKWRDELGATVPDVTEEDIAEIISAWTGVPVSRLVEEETSRLLRMEEEIHKRLIGQDDAVKVISQAVRRARAGLKDAKRPIGSFMFLGPTGVGKTELSRALAEFLFDNEDAIIRLDMSEFMERHSTARLVGSPPGYVGYDEGGQLTEAVRRRPYSVVLFDEIEKAHPEVFNMLLQILEDGRLSDAKGKAVNFSNTIIIMTSNLGVHGLKLNMSLGFQPAIPDERTSSSEHGKMRDSIMDELKKQFRPEFLNRVDAVVVFQRLDHPQMRQIVDLLLAKVAEHLAAQELVFTVADDAKDKLVEEGFDKIYGARPLRRVIQRVIEDPLSEELLRLKHGPGDHVMVEVVDGEVKMRLVPKGNRREKKEKAEVAAGAASGPPSAPPAE